MFIATKDEPCTLVQVKRTPQAIPAGKQRPIIGSQPPEPPSYRPYDQENEPDNDDLEPEPGEITTQRAGDETDVPHSVAGTPARCAGSRSRHVGASVAGQVSSDDTLRQKGGWLTSFRQLREQENVLRAERKLADGHASTQLPDAAPGPPHEEGS